MFSYLKYAKEYNERIGFNILPVVKKSPNLKWGAWKDKEMSSYDIAGFNWSREVTGIAGMSGVNNLRSLDFDDVKDESIIENFVDALGLSLDYEWIVKSGSGKGYHIWFKCTDDAQEIAQLGACKGIYNLHLRDVKYCDHIELRWKDCCTVLPPSRHKSGEDYSFLNIQDSILPRTEPAIINVNSVVDTIKLFCNMESLPPLFENGKLIKERRVIECQGARVCDPQKVEHAATFLKGKLDVYDDWLKCGFALATLGEIGRKYFHMISLDNPSYSDTEYAIDTKFTNLLKDQSGETTIGTFFHVAKKYGWDKNLIIEGENSEEFWSFNNKKCYIISSKFISFLEKQGYRKIIQGREPLYVKIIDNIVSKVNPIDLKDYVTEYLTSIADVVLREKVTEAVVKSATNLFSDITLEFLSTVKEQFLKDEKHTSYFFFIDCFVEVTDKSVNKQPYSALKGLIWDTQIIRREFAKVVHDDDTIADINKFVSNICSGDNSRISAIRSSIGYMLHRYKDPSNAKALIFLDEKLSENAFGRSGKGLLSRAIGEFRNLLKIDGKNFSFDKSFAFQSVNHDTAIIFFDDVNKKFDFEKLFSIITEGIEIEKKNKNAFYIPFEVAPKILIATNFSVKGSDDSSKDRQQIIEFSDFYNAKHKPVDDFGRQFFREWDDKEYVRFDHFMIECCQYYLSNGLIGYSYKNLLRKQLIDETSQDFEDFIDSLPIDMEHNKRKVFEQFKKEYPTEQFQQRTFTSWMKVYANLHDLSYQERKSGNNRFFTIKSWRQKP